MPTSIKLPNLGENVETGDVLSIFVSEGEIIEPEQDLLELETDKATLTVPASEGGRVLRILVAEGDTIAVGASILEIEPASNGAAPRADTSPQAERQQSPSPAPAAAVAEEPAASQASISTEPVYDRAPAAEAPQPRRMRPPAPPRPAAVETSVETPGDGPVVDRREPDSPPPGAAIGRRPAPRPSIRRRWPHHDR